MDQKQALKILIEHCFLLTEQVKQKLYFKLPSMSDQDINSLGKFLALEKKKSIETNKQLIQSLEELKKALKNTSDADLASE